MRVREASKAWAEIGRPFWAALSLMAGGTADTSEAVAALLRLEAPATAQAVRRHLAENKACRCLVDPGAPNAPTPPG